jgi:hypothetical protein
VLVRQMSRAMSGQRFEIGTLPIHEMQHQEPTEDQLVPVAKTGSQHPQAVGYAGGRQVRDKVRVS